jgi:negative regulator of sigma E activity
MECQEIRTMLSAYIDGEAAREEVGFIEDHLSSCRACAMELKELESVAGALAAAPELETPNFLLERIEAATIARKKPALRIRIPSLHVPGFAGFATAVAVVACVLIGGLTNHGVRPSATPQIARQPRPSVKIEVHPALPMIANAAIVAKAPAKNADAQTNKPRRSIHARRHHRHGLPEGRPSDGYFTPQLASRSKSEIKSADPESCGQTDDDSVDMAEMTPAAPATESPRLGVRVAAALNSVNASAETAALEDLRSSLASKNRQKRTYVYPEKDSVMGETYSVGIASIHF